MSNQPSVTSGDASFTPVGVIREPVLRRHRDERHAIERRYRSETGAEVLIDGALIERLEHISRSAAPAEWIGLLIGVVGEDERGRYVLVRDVVFDPDARASGVLVETSHASESSTRRLARLLFPDALILGWTHGHVRCGARYSPTDRRTQRSWRQPHAVGIVIDPWDPELLGVYLGPESERLDRVDDLREPPRAAPPARRSISTRLTPRRSHNRWPFVIACVTTILGAVGWRVRRVEQNLRSTAARLEAVERIGHTAPRAQHAEAPARASDGAPPAPVVNATAAKADAASSTGQHRS